MQLFKNKKPKAEFSSVEVKGIEPGSMEERVTKLHDVYVKTIKPLETLYKYDEFNPSWFEETVLNQKPLVTFFGPWSAGKTTFINHLLQHNYLKTGPQPTTDSFTVVVHGNEPTSIDGQVLASTKNLPFRGLDEFGEAFLRRFCGFQAPHPLLKRVTFVDTPGILESAQDIRKRGYDYAKVCRWFAERSDLIFVIFDPTKLDAGAELRMLFTYALNGFESRVRLILNKADSISPQELMRVYGSLFWNFSNLIRTTEPPRVYLGSFWNKPYREVGFANLFTAEKCDLLWELMNYVPVQARDRKVAAVIKRAKSVLLHALIVGTVRTKQPKVFMVQKATKKAINNLNETYTYIAKTNKINLDDFPPIAEEQKFLREHDVERFPTLEKSHKAIAAVRECIENTLPAMLRGVAAKAASPFDEEQCEELMHMYHLEIPKHDEENEQNGNDLMHYNNNINQINKQPYQIYNGGNTEMNTMKTVNPLQQPQHEMYNNTQPHLSSHAIGLSNTARSATAPSVNQSFVSIPQEEYQFLQQQQQQQQQSMNNVTRASATRRDIHSAVNYARSNNNNNNINDDDFVAHSQMRYSCSDFPVHRNVIASSAMPVSQSANFDRATLRQTSATQSLPIVNRNMGASPPQQQQIQQIQQQQQQIQQQQQQPEPESQSLIPMAYTRSSPHTTSALPVMEEGFHLGKNAEYNSDQHNSYENDNNNYNNNNNHEEEEETGIAASYSNQSNNNVNRNIPDNNCIEENNNVQQYQLQRRVVPSEEEEQEMQNNANQYHGEVEEDVDDDNVYNLVVGTDMGQQTSGVRNVLNINVEAYTNTVSTEGMEEEFASDSSSCTYN